MKILLINTVPTTKNGITNVIFNYLTAMDLNGVRMDYLSINTPETSYRYEVERRGGNFFVIPRSGKEIVSYYNNLKKLVRTEKYDIVHVHGNSHFNILDLLAAYKGGCKVRIVHCHNTTCGSPFLHKLLTPLFNRLYTQGFACGEDAGHWMFGNGPFSVINNGIKTDKYKFRQEIREIMRQQLGWENKYIIGNVSSIIPAKNHEFIVSVFNELHKEKPDSRLLLIGDGYLRDQIEAEIDNYGLRDVVNITGNIDNVNEYLNAIDCILMPSLYEGLPLTLIEQQANGLQCVVSDAISKEADKTGNLTFLSLQAPITEWVNMIWSKVCGECIQREKTSLQAIESIRKCGYSIDEEAQKVKAIYIKLIS